MILSKPQILSAIADKKIIYKNQPKTNLVNNQSVDVRLGQFLWFWDKTYAKFRLVDLEKIEYTLQPNSFVIAHTEEFIGTIAGSNFHPTFKLKSSAGRNGIVHTLAGHGDSGFINRWALEFTTMIPIELKRFMSIGQIYFTTTPDNQEDYADGGNYQNSSNIDELIKNWKPEELLPKPLKIIM